MTLLNTANIIDGVIGNTLCADAGNNTWLINTDNNGTISGTSVLNIESITANSGSTNTLVGDNIPDPAAAPESPVDYN